MKEITTSGMIIKETKVGEGNKIFTIISSDYGKIQASGAGVRSFKSKLSSGCSLFCYSDFKLKQGKSNDILNIISAEKNLDFFDIRYDIQKLALVNYICDIAGKICYDGMDCSEILKLLVNTAYYIQNNEYEKKTKPVFELRLLSESGFAPDVFCCEKCGSKNGISYFDVDSATVFCDKCILKSNINEGVIQAMRYVISSPLKKIFSFNIDEVSLHTFTSLCETYALKHIGKMPSSLNYLKSL